MERYLQKTNKQTDEQNGHRRAQTDWELSL